MGKFFSLIHSILYPVPSRQFTYHIQCGEGDGSGAGLGVDRSFIPGFLGTPGIWVEKKHKYSRGMGIGAGSGAGNGKGRD
jgi:hypothetical protein